MTYAWVQEYRRYASQYHLDTDLYVFQSFGNFNTDEGYNSGEYNITRLPDLRTFDGIILDLSNVSDASLKESFLAYRKTLEKHGILFEPERVIERSFEIKTGIRAFTKFQQKDLLPEAFVCANDNIAVGVCLAAREAGFSIPEDFLVTGFDNEDKASYCNPRITTADFSKTEIMYHAMELLVDIWNGKQTAGVLTHRQYIFFRKAAAACQNVLLTEVSTSLSVFSPKPARAICRTG